MTIRDWWDAKGRAYDQKTEQVTTAVQQRNVAAVRSLRDVPDDELIAQTRGQSSTAPPPHREMEMQRRLKDSIEALTRETSRALAGVLGVAGYRRLDCRPRCPHDRSRYEGLATAAHDPREAMRR